MHNAKVIEILTRLMILKYITEPVSESVKEHKKIAYERVIDGIRRLPENARSVNEITSRVSGIGKSINWNLVQIFQIDDPIRTGLPDLDNLLLTNIELFNKIAIMSQLIQVSGIGIKRAETLYDRGVRSVAEVALHSPEPMMSPQITGSQMGMMSPQMSGFQMVSPRVESIQEKYRSQLQQRIPHDKITNFGRFFAEMTKDLDLFFTIGGSYIRNTPTSGDIDMVVISKNNQVNIEQTMEIVIRRLQEAGIFLGTLTEGKARPTYVIYLDNENPAVQIDFLKLHKPEEYPYGLLYFTGSGKFNIGMKTYARRFGFTLGNTEMTDKSGNKVIVNSEPEIFSFFRIPYIPPMDRIEFPYK